MEELAARADEVRANLGDLVIVAPPDVRPDAPGVPVVPDEDGAIASRFRHLAEPWTPPVVFVADRYGEIMAVTDDSEENAADRVVRWLFSAEVQCSL